MAENYNLTAGGGLSTKENDEDAVENRQGPQTQHIQRAASRDLISGEKETENVSVVDDYSSDSDCTSEASLCADSDSLDERLWQPTKYFQDLDKLGSKVLKNSMYQFYTDGSQYKPFDGHTHFKVPHRGYTLLRKLEEIDIIRFYDKVLIEANEARAASDIASPSTREHYNANHRLDRAIENLFHLVECRNIILRAVENIEAMERASYCEDFISILVIDKARDNVARLLPIECSKVKQLAITFETCLSNVLPLSPATLLSDTEMTFANGVSEACQVLFSELGLDVPIMHFTEIWRCAVHVLDMAVLSYAGAHTQLFGGTEVVFALPGPFLKVQYFMFRRRSFLCLGKFLREQEAWVLERYHRNASRSHGLPQLYLSTNATTFGDIWGPMWTSCALINGKADHDQILQYSVGSGAIFPCSHLSSDPQDSVSIRKDEMLCHWVSDNDRDEIGTIIKSPRQTLRPDDTLLIGASKRLHYNQGCRPSTDEITQRLRDSGSLSEPGTMTYTWAVDSTAFQIQVGPPYFKPGAQRTYKRRGRTWKEDIIDNWKNDPESRKVRMLEFKLGVEVSSCTYNARRRRLITLLGSNTMVNHLRNGSLTWSSTDCEEQFYAALKSSNHKAFRNLYMSRRDWQPDLGKAITCCLASLGETGTNERGLDLLWVPNSEPGRRVNIKAHEHNWVSFLKDTEDSCTMAILENKCLELPDLTQIRKCQHQKFDTKPNAGSMSDQHVELSILETSFMVNQNAVPSSMYQVPVHGRSGSTTRQKSRWRSSSLEGGEKFNFGQKGQLKCVESLGNGQILATWQPPSDIWSMLRGMFLGSVSGNSYEKKHQEHIRDEKGEQGPLYVLILSSVPEKVTAQFGRRYDWTPSENARPRRLTKAVENELKKIMTHWKSYKPESEESLDRLGQDVLEVLAKLEAALQSRIEQSHGVTEQDMEQERGGLEQT